MEAAQNIQLWMIQEFTSQILIIDIFHILYQIQGGKTDAAIPKVFDHRPGVDQLPTGTVHQDNPLLHLLHGFLIHHMVIALQRRGVQGYDVAFPVQLIQIHIFRAVLQLFLRVDVIGQNPATEAGQVFNHRLTDAAGSDNPYGGVRQVLADLSLQAVILYLRSIHDVWNAAAGDQHHHDGVIRNGVRIVAHIGDSHPHLKGVLHIDVVVTDGAGGNYFYPVLLHGVHHLSRGWCGDDGNGIIPLSQVAVLRRRCFGGVIEGHVVFPGVFLKIRQFVEFPKAVYE